MADVHLSLEQVFDLAYLCLSSNGCNHDNAAAIARTLQRAERDACASHGLFRLPGYVASLQSGKVNGDAESEVRRISPAVIQVDGKRGFAPLALERGRDPLIEAARENGIAALALINVHHFAALWAEVEPIAERGLAAMAFTTYKSALVPAGSKQAFFGTNPMSFGWPRGDQPPLVFDQASAAMARGEVMIAARDGHTLPPGVGIDADGVATNDPNQILEGGAQLPFGGHKGSALAMMIELLVAGLTGQDFSFEATINDNNDGGPPNGGELMIAIDPTRFGDADNWLSHSETFITRLAGLEGARLPGDRRYNNRSKSDQDGVFVPEALYQKCLELKN